jgi:hypothetical protein
MIQPASTALSYGPFRGAFIFSILMLTAWIVLFILTTQYCSTNCLSYSSFINSCVSGGSLYCCSLYDSSGYYYCGYYNNCLLDNTACGGFSTGSWVAGSLAVLSIILMCLAAMKFKKLKQLTMMNYHNQNNGPWGNNQNPNEPIYYPPQPNQQYNNNPYQNQQNQGNYVPPRYYPQN